MKFIKIKGRSNPPSLYFYKLNNLEEVMVKKIENETSNLQDFELDVEAAEPTLQEVHLTAGNCK